jgi:hypothetical protein
MDMKWLVRIGSCLTCFGFVALNYALIRGSGCKEPHSREEFTKKVILQFILLVQSHSMIPLKILLYSQPRVKQRDSIISKLISRLWRLSCSSAAE